MSSVVTKCSPEVVGPSEQGALTGNTHLSSFDKATGPISISLLLVFDKPIFNPAETIKRALSRALVHYGPVSGRLASGADGGPPVITCGGEGEGVLFVAASASCAVDDVHSSTALLNDLWVHYPEEYMCRHADPLLLMQVTEFSCGGFVVGVTWNHILADGAGLGQFLRAIGELARGMSVPSIVPVRSDDSVLAAHPQGINVAFMASAERTMGMPFLDLTIPSSLISRVKAEVSLTLGKPCTVFEAAVALLWQCRTRAALSVSDDQHTTSSVFFGGNVRSLVGAAGGYYGNCLIVESVAAKCTEVANGDIKDVVKLIQLGKQKIQDNITNGHVADPVVRQQPGYNTLVVSSWRNLGLETPDFGGGCPARVMWYVNQASVPCCILCPPCKGKDGVNVLGYFCKKEHVDAFRQEFAAGDQ